MSTQLTSSSIATVALGSLLRALFTRWPVRRESAAAGSGDPLPERLRYDVGYSDLNPDRVRGSRGRGPDVGREMLRRMI